VFPAVCEILAKNIAILRKSYRGDGQTSPAASRVLPSTTTQHAQEPGELSRWEQHRRDGWEASGGRWTRSGGHPHVRRRGLQVVRLLAERSIDVSAGRRTQLGANVCPHTAIATRPQRRSVDKNRTSTRCSTFAANRNSFCIGPMTRTDMRCCRIPSRHQMISRTPILARFQRFEQELHRQHGRPALHSWSTISGGSACSPGGARSRRRSAPGGSWPLIVPAHHVRMMCRAVQAGSSGDRQVQKGHYFIYSSVPLH
jgi:hypothetical protein